MRILFLGEGELSGPARYLSAILRWSRIPFDHRPDQAKLPSPWRKRRYDAVVLSDYRYASWTPCAQRWLIQQVSERGTGLLMIGGYASFTGLVGGYAGTPIERLLPVNCVRIDDRVYRPTGALLLPDGGHPVFSGLTWNKPPVICGYHRIRVKPQSQTVASFCNLERHGSRVQMGQPTPALVLGHVGSARTGAFLTDCAPHWAGGLVDWGNARTRVRLGRHLSVELGNFYFRFFRQLIEWTASI